MTRLHVPELPEDVGLYEAAQLYAAAGWYVGPLHPDDPKNPGHYLGKSWQSKTSRDPDQIAVWFDDMDGSCPFSGVFLHVGRSGGVLFDVDTVALVDERLANAIWVNPEDCTDAPGDLIAKVPFQSTRIDVPGQGHYLFLQPSDRVLGNGHGGLSVEWGEVRGNNGIIVAEPSLHPAANGAYRWQVTGEIPPLTPDLDAALATAVPGEDVGSASDDRVETFIAKCDRADNANLMKTPLRKFDAAVKGGGSRHEACVKQMCWGLRYAYMGFFRADEFLEELRARFTASLKDERKRFPNAEFKSILAWAVAQVELIDPVVRRAEVEARLRARDEAREATRGAVQANQAADQVIDAEGVAIDRRTFIPSVMSTEETDPMGLLGVKIDPERYFQDKSAGVDVQLLADDVLEIGPLAVGPDGMFYEYRSGVWRMHKNVVRNRCVELLGGRYRQQHVINASDVVSARAWEITCEPVHEYLNCRNGMVDWKTGEIHPHDPAYFSTVQFPFDWPDRVEECPMFDRFLTDLLEPDYVELVWEMIGYLLYSGNPRQQAFMLYGEGNNGKGTLLRLLTAMLGKSNIATESLTSLSSNRFSTINLFGKIANIAGDMDATFQTETAMFKSLTGEDMVAAEHKYGSRFNFSCWAVPVFSINKIPGSADTTHGYLRRWLMIKFERSLTPEEIIPGFSDLLIAEIPGIAQKAIGHLRKVMMNGFKKDGKIADGLEEFAKAVDQVRLWVDECCRPMPIDPPYRRPRTEVYRAYKAWAAENGTGILRASEFYARLRNAGYNTEKKIGGVWYVEGLEVEVYRMKGETVDSTPDPWREDPEPTTDNLVDNSSTTG
jgi:P4 family phage/plasmid primase-like protien